MEEVETVEAWSHKFARLRHGHGWSLNDAADQFIAVSPFHELVQRDSVRRQIVRWERGEIETPAEPTRRAIAKMFDLPVDDFWPPKRSALEVPDRLGSEEFLELVSALQQSRVGVGHLAQAEAEVERLCSAYAGQDAESLTVEVNDWLRTLSGLVTGGRVDLRGHAQALRLTGWLALLRSCLMWDHGAEAESMAARVAAAGIAAELDDPVMAAWTWEIQAWIALTKGDMPLAVSLSNAGIDHAPTAPVAAQLHAQKAKAYARMGDQHKTETALEAIRQVLDANPSPHNVRNHFTVDPTKASFYAMDAHRVLGNNQLADALADTVIRTSSAPDGSVISPMRFAEAELTKALVMARAGAVDEALDLADQALAHGRRSVPSLSMVAREVGNEVGQSKPGIASEWVARLQA